MNKIAVFGKPGSGKSTLSKALAAATGIPFHPLDLLQYQQNGQPVERAIFDKAHAAILANDRWIIDGLGPMALFKQRIEAADTLIYIDLPYASSYWFVTKRGLKSFFVKPEGWPEGSSVIKGTLQSYKTLKRCPAFWNEAFTQRIEALGAEKTVHIIRSVDALNRFTLNQ